VRKREEVVGVVAGFLRVFMWGFFESRRDSNVGGLVEVGGSVRFISGGGCPFGTRPRFPRAAKTTRKTGLANKNPEKNQAAEARPF